MAPQYRLSTGSSALSTSSVQLTDRSHLESSICKTYARDWVMLDRGTPVKSDLDSSFAGSSITLMLRDPLRTSMSSLAHRSSLTSLPRVSSFCSEAESEPSTKAPATRSNSNSARRSTPESRARENSRTGSSTPITIHAEDVLLAVPPAMQQIHPGAAHQTALSDYSDAAFHSFSDCIDCSMASAEATRAWAGSDGYGTPGKNTPFRAEPQEQAQTDLFREPVRSAAYNMRPQLGALATPVVAAKPVPPDPLLGSESQIKAAIAALPSQVKAAIAVDVNARLPSMDSTGSGGERMPFLTFRSYDSLRCFDPRGTPLARSRSLVQPRSGNHSYTFADSSGNHDDSGTSDATSSCVPGRTPPLPVRRQRTSPAWSTGGSGNRNSRSLSASRPATPQTMVLVSPSLDCNTHGSGVSSDLPGDQIDGTRRASGRGVVNCGAPQESDPSLRDTCLPAPPVSWRASLDCWDCSLQRPRAPTRPHIPHIPLAEVKCLDSKDWDAPRDGPALSSSKPLRAQDDHSHTDTGAGALCLPVERKTSVASSCPTVPCGIEARSRSVTERCVSQRAICPSSRDTSTSVVRSSSLEVRRDIDGGVTVGFIEDRHRCTAKRPTRERSIPSKVNRERSTSTTASTAAPSSKINRERSTSTIASTSAPSIAAPSTASLGTSSHLSSPRRLRSASLESRAEGNQVVVGFKEDRFRPSSRERSLSTSRSQPLFVEADSSRTFQGLTSQPVATVVSSVANDPWAMLDACSSSRGRCSPKNGAHSSPRELRSPPRRPVQRRPLLRSSAKARSSCDAGCQADLGNGHIGDPSCAIMTAAATWTIGVFDAMEEAIRLGKY